MTEDTNNDKTYTSSVLEEARIDLESPYLSKSNDLHIAYYAGMYFNAVSYKQKSILNTAGLKKKLRLVLSRMDESKLDSLIADCNRVAFSILTKDPSATFEWIREPLQEAIKNGQWESNSNQLTNSFMMGYDVSRRTAIQRKKESNK